MTYLRIVKWAEFQHYKDRNPPWIKLHRDLLSSPQWVMGNDNQHALMIAMMLLAARFDNLVPADPTYIQRVAYLDVPADIDWLVGCGFCEPAEQMLRDGTLCVAEATQNKWPSRYVSEKLRLQVLERDGNKCVKCGKTTDLEIDHVVPVSKGGESKLENLQTLCRPCNRRKRVRVEGAAQTRVASATQNKVQRSPETERETEVEKETKTKTPGVDVSETDQATQELFIELGLAGMSNRIKCEHAIQACMHKLKIDARAAAQLLLERWGKYDAAEVKFKTTKVGFLEKGLWENEGLWTQKSVPVSMGGW
jgi:HNH endonuclease